MPDFDFDEEDGAEPPAAPDTVAPAGKRKAAAPELPASTQAAFAADLDSDTNGEDGTEASAMPADPSTDESDLEAAAAEKDKALLAQAWDNLMNSTSANLA